MAGKGRGWHGDPEGHAKAGRKGGEARARKLREKKRMGGVSDRSEGQM